MKNTIKGTVEVICTFCGTPFHRYYSHTINAKGERRKVFKCASCKRVDYRKRFWAKVDKTSSQKGCWLWTAALNADGYPHFPCPEIKEYRGNRIAWVLCRGPIPEGQYVLHKPACHNRLCVNPDHCYLGTQHENMRDAVDQGTIMRGEDHIHAKLTEEDVKEIRRLYENGRVEYGAAIKLAEKLGVSADTVRHIGAGRYWKHIT